MALNFKHKHLTAPEHKSAYHCLSLILWVILSLESHILHVAVQPRYCGKKKKTKKNLNQPKQSRVGIQEIKIDTNESDTQFKYF
jgi:hypothetical protein